MHPVKTILITLITSFLFTSCNESGNLDSSKVLNKVNKADDLDLLPAEGDKSEIHTGETGSYGTDTQSGGDGGSIPSVILAGPILLPIPTPTVVATPTPTLSASPTPEPTASATPSATPTPTPTPPPNLRCQFDRVALNPGQSTNITWILENAPSDSPLFRFYLDSSLAQVSWGSITQINNLEVRYQAPTQVLQEFDVRVVAEAISSEYETLVPTPCTIRLSRGGDLGVPDDGLTRGLVGEIFDVGNISELPNFNLLMVLDTIVISNLDIPVRAFTEGFPGVRDLYEWFGISFRGRIIVPENREYAFRIISDDGSRLLINGQTVVNNDGVHAVVTRDGNVTLEAGIHDIEIQYFQGPRYHIALQLFWKNPATDAFVIIPPDNFRRPQ